MLKPLESVSYRLVVQQNGMIVLETRGDRFVRTSAAHDLRFSLEHKMQDNSWKSFGDFCDEITARQCLAESKFKSRLVARNEQHPEYGSVVLPKFWRGYHG